MKSDDVFGRNMERQGYIIKIDDAEILSALIETTTSVQGHTEYVVRVQRGPLPDVSWIVRRRYNDFVMLHGSLQISNIDLPLPPKKVFGNMDREFIGVRQQGLQNYLNAVLSYPLLALSLPVKRFLDPVNYLHNFQEKALQHVFMTFRSEPTWHVVEALPDIGWRIRKHYFLVRKHSEPKQDYIMTWCNYGPDTCMGDQELRSVTKFLTNATHPLIKLPLMVSNDKKGGVAVYDFIPDGSLKDVIFKCKPRFPYIKKYRPLKSSSPIAIKEIKLYGRQILESLGYLHSKGIPYGNLHSSNVFIEAGSCQIVGLENIFFGLTSFYRTFATQLRKVKTLQDLDIYAFGHIMYEMTFGETLNKSTCDNYPQTCPPEIKSVLESILTMEACKGGLPSAENLLTHPFFCDVKLSPIGKPNFKLTSHLREAFREVQMRAELRLIQDQKLKRQVQRLLRAQAILSEENQAPKRNNLIKKVRESSKETRSVSPGGSTENGSSCAPTPPPVLNKVTANPEVQIPSPNQTEDTVIKKVTDAPSLVQTPKPENSGRSALLGAIESFSKNKLRRATGKILSGAQTQYSGVA